MPDAPMTDEGLVAAWEAVQRAVSSTHQRILRHIDLGGQSPLWFSVLHLLLNNAEHRLPMTSLARELSMTSGGFTKLADRMAREGFIDRRGSSGDRRVVFASLTPTGLLTAEKCEAQYQQALREHVLDVLTPAIFSALIRAAALLSGSGEGGPESSPGTQSPAEVAEAVDDEADHAPRRRSGDVR